MINPLKQYSLTEVMRLSEEGLFPIRTRATLIKLIQNGKLIAINRSSGKKPLYEITGENLLIFLSSSSLEIQNVNGRRSKKETSKSSQVS